MITEHTDLEKEVKLPYVVPGKVLMSPGVWNGMFYNSKEIKNAFENTNWDLKENRSLFLDHFDGKPGDFGSLTWVGEVKNQRLEGDNVVGDLIVVDKQTAIKLAYGAKMGISPKVAGKDDNGRLVDFQFDNFSIVINPAIKTAYINNSQKDLSEVQKDDSPVEKEEDLAIKEENMSEEATTTTAQTVEASQKPAELSASDVVAALNEFKATLSETLKAIQSLACKPKEELSDEAPEEDAKPADAPAEQEMSEKAFENAKTIKELSEKVAFLEGKLMEPDRATAKSEELSQAQNPDQAFLSALLSM